MAYAKSESGERRYFFVDEVFSFVYSQIVHIGLFLERFAFKHQISRIVYGVNKYCEVFFLFFGEKNKMEFGLF